MTILEVVQIRTFFYVFGYEIKDHLLGLFLTDLTVSNSLGQTRLAMVRRVPLIHTIYQIIFLMDYNVGPLQKKNLLHISDTNATMRG